MQSTKLTKRKKPSNETEQSSNIEIKSSLTVDFNFINLKKSRYCLELVCFHDFIFPFQFFQVTVGFISEFKIMHAV